MNDSIYKEFILSKSNRQIPLLKNNKSIESRYNPEREAENIINEFSKDISFLVLIGIGSGILIEELIKKFPEIKIIGIEHSINDINFLLNNPLLKKLSTYQNISLISSTEISKCLLHNYIPALHGNLTIYENKFWANENPLLSKEIIRQINTTLNIIKQDFSVQSHFGKIWQTNILNNLKNLKSQYIKNSFNTSQTAAIIAAGPSLDQTIHELRKKDYYIIATDTAFSSLIKNKIIPNVVLSLDGQSVSYNHFFDCENNILKKTIFLFDLCGNFSSAKKIIENNGMVSFFTSGHPLSNFASNCYKEKFPNLYSGAGTVTIACLDFALKSGFSNIEIFGADFSYLNGKSYTKGTYLDSLYCFSSSKINSTEKIFSKLIYRTKLIKSGEKKYTTELLTNYRNSMLDFLKFNNCQTNESNNIFYVTNNNAQRIIDFFSSDFDFYSFIKQLYKTSDFSVYLPYIAWLRKNADYQNLNFDQLLQLARNSLLLYN